MKEAARLRPDSTVHYPLAMLLAAQGQPAEAVEHYQAALKTTPGVSAIHYHLGRAFAALRDWPAATAAFRRAVELEPASPLPHAALAWVLHHQGQGAGFEEERRRTLQLDPQWPQSAARHAWTLATHPDARVRNGPWALALAEQAVQLSEEKDPHLLDVLAAALAEVGDYTRAVTIAQHGQALANRLRQPGLAKEIEGRLRTYEKKTPFRSTGSAER
jgi:tetratricopeptide (TPR) repeat protein